MKFLGVTVASLGFASAASVAKRVSYDDWKVYRVNVGSSAVNISNVMSKLQLELWKGKPASSDVVDVMVPPSAVKDFEASTSDIETSVMHSNLGLSIEEENNFSVYIGKASHRTAKHGCGAKEKPQPVLLRVRLGSTRTIRSPITCNGSRTLRLRTLIMRKSYLLGSPPRAAT
jgi:hypothetical protein